MKDKAVDLKKYLNSDLINLYRNENSSFYLIINDDLEITYFSEDSLYFFNITTTVDIDNYKLHNFIGNENSEYIKGNLSKYSNENELYCLPSPMKNFDYKLKIKLFNINDKKNYFLIFIKTENDKKTIEESILDLYKISFEKLNIPLAIIKDNKFLINNYDFNIFLKSFNINKYDEFNNWILSNIYDNTMIDKHLLDNEYNIKISINNQIYNINKIILNHDYRLIKIIKDVKEEKVIYKEEIKQTDQINDEKDKYTNQVIFLKNELNKIKNSIDNYNNDVFEKFNTSSDTVIKNIKSSINDYNEIISYTTESLTTMSENSTFIDEISIRIHLISINAAIESARSGEHGKGFAVISKEIAKLSEAIKGYAKSITSEIENITKYTRSITKEKKEEIINTDELFKNISNLQEFVKITITDFKNIIINKIDELSNIL